MIPQQNFKIVIPFYNCEKYIAKCIQSILSQTYKNYQVVIIDDCSNDKSSEVCINQLKSCVSEDKLKFKYFKRSQNVGALENIVHGIQTICNDPQDVILTIDGDDYLYGNDVLETLNFEYRNENIWLTYGSYQNLSDGSRGLCAPMPCDTKDYRKSGMWVTSHLRTWKKFLWDKIDNKDLRDSSGRYYSMSWDRIFLYCLTEMATNAHIKYIEKILYIYNNVNDLNDHKKNLQLQLAMAEEIRNKPIYNPIK